MRFYKTILLLTVSLITLSFFLLDLQILTSHPTQVLAVGTDVLSVKSGNWNDPTVWSTGVLPTSEDRVIVSNTHTVSYNVTTTNVAGVKVEAGGKLVFDPAMSATLQTNKNVVVEGELVMKPTAATSLHILRFINVDETKFVGGGMDVKETDVGLWVMGAGKLDIEGAAKTAWTRAVGAIASGTNTITLVAAPTGWRVGDAIRIAPTESTGAGTNSWGVFDTGTITAINGAVVTLNTATTRPHPMVNNKWTAEVMNLTRNVRIEGTGNGASANTTNGRAHVFIRSTQPQNIKYLALRLMGPRRDSGDSYNGGNGVRVPIYEGYLGRYVLHFHHNMEGSRGTIVEGVVADKSGAHVFVPHASHGITMKDMIAYDSWDDPYWWDPPTDSTSLDHSSNDVVFDHSIAAMVKVDPSFRGSGMSAFMLSTGENPVVRNSVAVGVQGNSTSSGFKWPESANHHPLNVWTFEDNISHNNKVNGIYIWQNDVHPHLLTRYAGYNNGQAGIDHGAYTNAYNFQDLELIGNGSGLIVHATPNGSSVRPDGYKLAYERFTADTRILFTKHNASNVNSKPNLFKDCNLIAKINGTTGLPNPKVVVDEKVNSGTKAAWNDFVNCNLEPSEIKITSALPGSRIRVQRSDGTAYQVDYLGVVTVINPFYTYTP